MANIPKKPEDIFDELTSDIREVFGSRLVSIFLYGSGASADYIPGKSDLNFLFLLSEEQDGDLQKVQAIFPKWKKRRVALPLIMTRDFMLSSLDSYPIEFLNIKGRHVTVFGEDALGSLVFDPAALRLQAERELKGKMLLLKMRYLETEGKGARIESLIKESITAFLSIFHALLYLKGAGIPQGRKDVVRVLEKVFTFNANVFIECIDIKEGRRRVAVRELESIIHAYLKELVSLAHQVNGMKI